MLSFTNSYLWGEKIDYAKYCLIIISFVFVSIQIQAQNGWARVNNMPTPRAGATASVVDGKIYVIGGSITDLIDVATNEMYNPSTDTWDTTLAPMPTPRGFLTSEVVNGIIYVIGGGFPTATNKNEAYNPVTNTWDTTLTDMPGPPRLGMRAGVVNGIIYVIGGNYNQRDCYAYNPLTDTWDTTLTPMPAGGGALSVTSYNGLVYTFGGSIDPIWTPIDAVYAYNPQINTWTQKQNMPTPRFELHTYLVGDTIFAVGGSQSDGTSIATVEAYYPIADTFDTRPDMPIQRSFFAGAFTNNNIYVIGGTTDWSTFFGEVWVDSFWIIPVELTSFTASANGKEVTLSWSTATETNNQGFEIERRIITGGISGDWNKIGFTPGFGTTTEPKEYSYVDNISGINANVLAYRLKQIDFDGSYKYSDEVFADNLSPVEFVLEQNYPNPFNPVTTIGYGVQNKSNVKITVFNSIGEEVAVMLNEEKGPGFHQVEFNAANLPSGVYFYQLRAGSCTATKKMILMK